MTLTFDQNAYRNLLAEVAPVAVETIAHPLYSIHAIALQTTNFRLSVFALCWFCLHHNFHITT